jgi:hypothetical protein
MIKEILVVLMILSIASIASATSPSCRNCYVNVETPVYENNNLYITWYYSYVPSTANIKLTIFEQYDDGGLSTQFWVNTKNDGKEIVTNTLNVDHNYIVTIGEHNRGVSSDTFTIEETPIEVPLPPPPAPRQFNGYSFGNGDCNRMAILMGQSPNAHATYTMETISWDYKYTVPEMISYCERQGADMTPITDGFYNWEP